MQNYIPSHEKKKKKKKKKRFLQIPLPFEFLRIPLTRKKISLNANYDAMLSSRSETDIDTVKL